MNCKQEKYKRLGDYIQEVDVRNRDLQCTNLLGLSISKVFIPSIANTVGTDFRPYKIVKHNQFAYVPVTSRNGEKITVALYDGQEDCIISQAYISFEIKDTEHLLPEYLMMWFRRPEFDRYARFKSHGSAREVFDWEEMCNVMMPIPDIEEQQHIVNQYNTIQKHIEANLQKIAKLERTAQTIYRKMFVDEIDTENLPEGWKYDSIGHIYNVIYGKSLLTEKLTPTGYLVYGGNGVIGYYTEYLYENPQVLISCRGVASGAVHLTKPYAFVTSNSLVCEIRDNTIGVNYSYYTLSNLDLSQYQSGSAQPQITVNDIYDVELLIPDKNSCDKFEEIVSPIKHHINLIEKENEILENAVHTIIKIM